MSKKGGYYCAFKNCRGLSRRDKRSFFRFPKDPQRSKQWVRACDRSDLLEKTPLELFNSYRVCAKHFTDSMFLNDLRNRLQPNSVPVQLEPPEQLNHHHHHNHNQHNAIVGDSSSSSDRINDDNNVLDNNGDTRNHNHNSNHNHSSNNNTGGKSRRDELLLPDCQDSVAKLLSNCILQKISADEFFKATGIRINEPVSTVKTSDDYFNENTSPSDHIYSSTKANLNNNNNNNNNALAIDIDNENPSNFSIEALSYQDLINSLPMSLISAPSTESSMETSELPSFVITDKGIDKQLPDNILDDQTNGFESSIEAPRHNHHQHQSTTTEDLLDFMNYKGNNNRTEESCTQTDVDFTLETTNNVDYNNYEETSQTDRDRDNKIRLTLSEESTQTESNLNFGGLVAAEAASSDNRVDVVENASQTEEEGIASSISQDKQDKRKLRKLLLSKEHKIKELKSLLQRNFADLLDNVTLKQYELLTDKFFPKETSGFVKVQAQLFKKKTSDRKYSLEFKKQCLSLFLAGPRTYKNLQKLFCLPGVRDLQMLKY